MCRKKKFDELVIEVENCNKCTGMIEKTGVLGKENGNLYSNLFFLGEAPGRLGCDRTRIPFHGDRTGDIFEELLYSIEITRNDVYITNSVLCNPICEKGNNRKPSKQEIDTCINFLEKQLLLIKPEIIVTIGATALNTLINIKPHKFILKKNVAMILDWNGYKLFPLYHTSPLALMHRSKEKQIQDWKKLRKFINRKNLL